MTVLRRRKKGERKTGYEWAQYTGVIVMDHAGWKHRKKKWSEKISLDEFVEMAMDSATHVTPLGEAFLSNYLPGDKR